MNFGSLLGLRMFYLDAPPAAYQKMLLHFLLIVLDVTEIKILVTLLS